MPRKRCEHLNGELQISTIHKTTWDVAKGEVDLDEYEPEEGKRYIFDCSDCGKLFMYWERNAPDWLQYYVLRLQRKV